VLLPFVGAYDPQSPYANGFAMLVSHPQDAACTDPTRGYRALLEPDDRSFVWCLLDPLVNVIDAVADKPAHWKWLHDFRVRYLCLIRSESAWIDRER